MWRTAFVVLVLAALPFHSANGSPVHPATTHKSAPVTTASHNAQKKTLLTPSHSDGEAPVIKKTKAQVVSVGETTAQLMDSESFEIYELPVIEELAGKLHPGNEVEVIEAMGRRAMSRILGG